MSFGTRHQKQAVDGVVLDTPRWEGARNARFLVRMLAFLIAAAPTMRPGKAGGLVDSRHSVDSNVANP